jgi:hypothetical protein
MLGVFHKSLTAEALSGFFCIALWYFEAPAGIAVSLSIMMAIAWMVQQRTGNSGWVDTIWTFSVGLAGAGSALWQTPGARRAGGVHYQRTALDWLGNFSSRHRACSATPAAANGASAVTGCGRLEEFVIAGA